MMLDRRKFLGALTAAPLLAQPARPNVIVFLTDDLGYADIGCYGAKDIKTPHIDRLAKEGAKLPDFYSNGPVCTPTRAGLMTGRYQQRFGLEWAFGPGNKSWGLEAKHNTVARYLKNSGYKTAMYGKWHLGYDAQYGPNAHGFDEFFGLLSGNVDFYSHQEVNGEHDLYENTTPVKKEGYLTELLADRAEKFVSQQSAGQPFFLYVAFNGVHWPFQAPGRPQDVRNRQTWFDGTRADYARMVESVDTAVGRVLKQLDERGLTRDTMVIFTNDNGGERLSDNRPWFHHKATLWEGGIKVPALVRWPARIKPSQNITQTAISMDLTATILAACGVQPAADQPLDGLDLLPFLTGQRPPVDRTLFWRIDRADRKTKAVRMGKWKFQRDGAIDVLYDLTKDPGERVEMGYAHPEIVTEAKKRIAAWEADLAKDPPPKSVK